MDPTNSGVPTNINMREGESPQILPEWPWSRNDMTDVRQARGRPHQREL